MRKPPSTSDSIADPPALWLPGQSLGAGKCEQSGQKPMDCPLPPVTEPPRLTVPALAQMSSGVAESQRRNSGNDLSQNSDLKIAAAEIANAANREQEPKVIVDLETVDLETVELQSVDRKSLGSVSQESRAKLRSWIAFPFWFFGRVLDLVSLLVLLAVVAGIPIVQFASLGYILNAAARLAAGEPWSRSLPGLRSAGRLGTFVLCACLLWLPLWLITSVSYSAQLLQPGSNLAFAWRLGAFAATFTWIIYVAWAAMRGGRWWHFLWPAPKQFLRTAFRPSTWRDANEELYQFVSHLQFVKLWWLGLRAAAGALAWTAIPVSMMIIGQRAQDLPIAAPLGLVGAIAMMVVALYLPFLQIQMAREDRFLAVFGIRTVRRRYLYAPWAHTVALLVLCLLTIPLYLLRIEATPVELLWLPSLVFVVFMLPCKLLLGASMGYAETRRDRLQRKMRHWVSRWPARTISVASVAIYVGALYVAQLVAGQGAFVMYFQHAFLVPAPLISS